MNFHWHLTREEMPQPIQKVQDRNMQNAVLIYTPVDGMINVGWYLGVDYRNRPEWITATATNRSYQCCTKKVTQWMPIPLPEWCECFERGNE